jgi:hypothetical protein
MTNTEYEKLMLKVPKESQDYIECSDFVVNAVEKIIQKAMDEERNKIVINTNLRLGIPMENVNSRPIY